MLQVCSMSTGRNMAGSTGLASLHPQAIYTAALCRKAKQIRKRAMLTAAFAAPWQRLSIETPGQGKLW